MNYEILTEGSERYLCIDAAGGTDTFEYRMLTQNDLSGFLPIHLLRKDNRSCFLYPITGLLSLQEAILSGDRDYLESTILGLERAEEILEAYFLSPDRLVLSPDMIFIRPETGMLYFCYHPGKSGEIRESLESLMEFFVKSLNPTEENDVLCLYGLYQRTRESNTTIATIVSFWRAEMKKKQPEEVHREVLPTFIEEEDNEYYESLGLSLPTKKNLFSAWLSKKQRLPNDGTSGEQTAESAESRNETVQDCPWDEEVINQEPVEEAGNAIRRHAFEIVVGAVFVAVLVLIFLF